VGVAGHIHFGKGKSITEAKNRFEPFYEIRHRDEAARNAVVRMARRAITRNIPAFLIVHLFQFGFSGEERPGKTKLEQVCVVPLGVFALLTYGAKNIPLPQILIFREKPKCERYKQSVRGEQSANY